MNIRILYFLSLILLLTGCISRDYIYNLTLNNAILTAGENRNEIETILNYYKDSPEKSEAAGFLITHMPFHYSLKEEEKMNDLYNQLDSLFTKYQNTEDLNLIDSLYTSILRKNVIQYEYISDIEIIKSDYLIEQIDKTFDLWENNNWGNNISFNDFCEYILPYKVCEEQPIDNWKEYLYDFAREDLEYFKYHHLLQTSVCNACETVNSTLKEQMSYFIRLKSNNFSIKRMNTLRHMPYGTCEDYAIITAATMRAKGIPVAIDFTPQWPRQSSGHTWNALIEPVNKSIAFEGASIFPSSPLKLGNKLAKTFRKTYSANPEVLNIYSTEKFIPNLISQPFIKDVTDEYVEVDDIHIKIEKRTTHKYAYLTVFNNITWMPVYWGEVKNKNITFKRMGRNVVYLPSFYGSSGVEPCGLPFILENNGNIRTLKPDTTRTREIILNRKYHPDHRTFKMGRRIMGGKIQVASDSSFTDSLTLHTITNYGDLPYEIRFDTINQKYQYWRYYSPDKSHGNIAELYFYEKDSTTHTQGDILGTPGSWRDRKGYEKEAAFDGNPLTFFDAQELNENWVGLDFGKPIQIERIIYYPRNDGNCIEFDNEYELFYWDEHKWNSLGRKIANEITISFDKCPENALFLLHNHTQGVEERIFTYENNRQIWW